MISGHSLSFGNRYLTKWAFTGGEPQFTHEFIVQIETKTGMARVMEDEDFADGMAQSSLIVIISILKGWAGIMMECGSAQHTQGNL